MTAKKPCKRLLVCGLAAAAIAIVVVAVLGFRGESRPNAVIDRELEALRAEGVMTSDDVPFPEVESTHFHALVEAGCRDMPYLIAKMRKGDYFVKLYCASAMGHIGSPEAAAALIDLDSGRMGVPFSLSSLWQRDDRNWPAGIAYVTHDAMRRIKDPKISSYALSTLRDILKHKSVHMHHLAMIYAGILMDQGVDADVQAGACAIKDVQKNSSSPELFDSVLEALKQYP